MSIDLETKNQLDDILIDGLALCMPERTQLESLLKSAKKENKKLRVKLGIDPTNPDLHLGHTVCLQALKKFQKYGHLPILIIGGFTATVGDPSGRNETRPPLTYEQVKQNAKTYLDQVNKILDIKNIEIHNNYDWFKDISLAELLKLAHIVTINQLIAKEAFGKRIDEGNPLYLHELLYPILQGYDSYKIKADIEIGGVDQTFNVLFGRNVQKFYSQPEQLSVFYPLLIGLDGRKKMSKSFGNYIALNDTSDQIYGKTMSIPDELIINYFSLVTDLSVEQISSYKLQLERDKSGKKLDSDKSAKDLKMELGRKLVEQIYNKDKSLQAENNFIKQFKENKIPDEIDNYKLQGDLKITDLMLQSKIVPSKAEAKRLIEGGCVKLESLKINDPNFIITEKHKNSILQVGKRRFIKII